LDPKNIVVEVMASLPNSLRKSLVTSSLEGTKSESWEIGLKIIQPSIPLVVDLSYQVQR